MPVPKIAFPSIVRTPSFPEGLPQDLNDCVVEQVRTLYAKHGPAAFAMPKDAAAAHEAGHAIVGTHEGLAITGVKIFSRQVPLLAKHGPAFAMARLGGQTPARALRTISAILG